MKNGMDEGLKGWHGCCRGALKLVAVIVPSSTCCWLAVDDSRREVTF
jgi:hypothetical protein